MSEELHGFSAVVFPPNGGRYGPVIRVSLGEHSDLTGAFDLAPCELISPFNKNTRRTRNIPLTYVQFFDVFSRSCDDVTTHERMKMLLSVDEDGLNHKGMLSGYNHLNEKYPMECGFFPSFTEENGRIWGIYAIVMSDSDYEEKFLPSRSSVELYEMDLEEYMGTSVTFRTTGCDDKVHQKECDSFSQ